MACAAIFIQTDFRIRKANLLLVQSPPVWSRRVALLVLVVHLLSLSAQTHATIVCVSIDGGEPFCEEVDDYRPGFWPDDGSDSSSGNAGGGVGDGSGGGLAPGATPENPRVAQEVAECGVDHSLCRESQASLIVRNEILELCVGNAHAAHGFWRVEWSDGTFGIYEAMLSCREFPFLNEVQAPGC